MIRRAIVLGIVLSASVAAAQSLEQLEQAKALFSTAPRTQNTDLETGRSVR